MKQKKISAKELDEKFDENQEEIVQHFDQENVERPGWEPKRVNVDFPMWMIQKLDREAKRLNISRQAVIKSWISDRLKAERHSVIS